MSKKVRVTYQKAHLEHAQKVLRSIMEMEEKIPPTVLKLCGNALRILNWHIKNSTGHHPPSGGPGKPPAGT